MSQRLTLGQGKPNIAKGVFIQFATEQGTVGGLPVGCIQPNGEVERVS